MTNVHDHSDKSAPRKAYGPMPTVAKRWAITSRVPGSAGAGEQASPSVFTGTDEMAKAHCAELTAASQEPGHGPAREYIYAAA